MTVGELQARASQRELTEWQILARIEREEADQRELKRKAEAGLKEQKARRKARR